MRQTQRSGADRHHDPTNSTGNSLWPFAACLIVRASTGIGCRGVPIIATRTATARLRFASFEIFAQRPPKPVLSRMCRDIFRRGLRRVVVIIHGSSNFRRS
ncbi:MAG: hypothetical protein BGP05_07975 [Rhizobiales bacterium 62-47]|nr:MAG: hypothetical protein BGP05_07975 [Rhizobiales bacterium 62-47]